MYIVHTMSSGMASKLVTPSIFEMSASGASLLTHMYILCVNLKFDDKRRRETERERERRWKEREKERREIKMETDKGRNKGERGKEGEKKDTR